MQQNCQHIFATGYQRAKNEMENNWKSQTEICCYIETKRMVFACRDHKNTHEW